MVARQKKTESEPRVLVTLYDFVAWLLRATNRFPKNHRATLGDRLDGVALDMLLFGARSHGPPWERIPNQELAVRTSPYRFLFVPFVFFVVNLSWGREEPRAQAPPSPANPEQERPVQFSLPA